MLVKQVNKQYRADIVFFRNNTEEFTCSNETAQVCWSWEWVDGGDQFHAVSERKGTDLLLLC